MNGEGSISIHKGTGLWVAQIYAHGKRLRKYAKTKALAKAKLDDIRTRQSKGLRAFNSSMLLKDYLPE